ncbi:PA14 domain-containing protein [Streptomyces mirabilis]|uniref:PA14 domain-containing protein n=1 Tax=Streptomyces mirabilis TaxID=68239 RepID=UPI003322AD6D
MRPVGRSGPALASTLTIATTGGLLAVSGAPASAASSCASPAYKRQFYANTTFSGTPKKTDCDAAVSENWGTKAPASGLPKDNFGVRWTATRDFDRTALDAAGTSPRVPWPPSASARTSPRRPPSPG